MTEETNLLLQFFDNVVVPMMREQIRKDTQRWGDTFLKRPKEGQEDRCFARFRDYYDQFKNAGKPIPWTKVIGECNIALLRESGLWDTVKIEEE